MTDVVVNTWVLLLVAITNLVTAGLVLIAKSDIRKIEIATNSMKDALVASTAKASMAAGKAEGKLEERSEVAERKATRAANDKGA